MKEQLGFLDTDQGKEPVKTAAEMQDPANWSVADQIARAADLQRASTLRAYDDLEHRRSGSAVTDQGHGVNQNRAAVETAKEQRTDAALEAVMGAQDRVPTALEQTVGEEVTRRVAAADRAAQAPITPPAPMTAREALGGEPVDDSTLSPQ